MMHTEHVHIQSPCIITSVLSMDGVIYAVIYECVE